MPFGRLHEEAAGESKLLALSDAAWRMWAMGLIYCQKNLTDGFIDAFAIATFGVRDRNLDRVAEELCKPQVRGRAPLWAKVEGGFEVHDYLQWNDSKEEILAGRSKAKDRVGRWRQRHDADRVRNGVRNASGNALQNDVPNGEPNGSQNASPNAFADALPVVRGTCTSESSDPEGVQGEPSAGVFDAYRLGWKAAYGYDCSLILKPLDQMQLDQQVAAHGWERLLEALDAYFACTDDYVRKARHPFALFLRDPLKYLAAPKSAPLAGNRSCPHTPTCTSFRTCTDRILAESREHARTATA